MKSFAVYVILLPPYVFLLGFDWNGTDGSPKTLGVPLGCLPLMPLVPCLPVGARASMSLATNDIKTRGRSLVELSAVPIIVDCFFIRFFAEFQ